MDPNMKKTVTNVSERGISEICQFETGKKFGYKMTPKDLNGYDNKDAGGKKTYGYGLLYHPSGKKFMQDVKQVWTQPELEELFKETLAKKARKIVKWAESHDIVLGQGQMDAMVSAVYNFGEGFLNKNICKVIADDPNDPKIPEMWAHLSDAQGKKYPGLLTRRRCEASWYKEDIK